MPAPLSIRTDRDAGELGGSPDASATDEGSDGQLALANALDGLPREEAARMAGMTGASDRGLGAPLPPGGHRGAAGPARRAGAARGRRAAGRTQGMIHKGSKLERKG